MNSAGNADLVKNARSRTIYSQLILPLVAWLTLSGVLLITRALNRFGSISNRELYDVLTLSSFTMLIATLIAASLFKMKAGATIAVSSFLLAVTYYIRLSYILFLENGAAVLLPLVTIIRFEKTGSGSIVLDLGQLGLCVFLYLLIKNLPIKSYLRRIVYPVQPTLLSLVKKNRNDQI